MKKWIAVAGVSLIAAVAMVLSASAAGDTGKKHSPQPNTDGGTIAAISPNCITISLAPFYTLAPPAPPPKKVYVRIAMDRNTVFGTQEDPKKYGDFKVGDKVWVTYTNDSDRKYAIAILPRK